MTPKEKAQIISALDNMAMALQEQGHKFSPKLRKEYEAAIELLQGGGK